MYLNWSSIIAKSEIGNEIFEKYCFDIFIYPSNMCFSGTVHLSHTRVGKNTTHFHTESVEDGFSRSFIISHMSEGESKH